MSNTKIISLAGHLHAFIVSNLSDEESDEAQITGKLAQSFLGTTTNINGEQYLIQWLSENNWSSYLHLCDGCVFVVSLGYPIILFPSTKLEEIFKAGIVPIIVIEGLEEEFINTASEIFRKIEHTFHYINLCGNKYHKVFRPTDDNVIFASSSGKWGFTLSQFASMYSKRYGMDPKLLTDKMWGEFAFDSHTKTWVTTTQKQRTPFFQWIMDPIDKMLCACQDCRWDNIEAQIQWIESQTLVKIPLSQTERELKGKHLIAATVGKWIPLSNAIGNAITKYVLSPEMSQMIRASMLKFPDNRHAANAIQQMKADGPLMIQMSTNFFNKDDNGFMSTARILSGTVKPGQNLVKLESTATFQAVTLDKDTNTSKPTEVACGNLCVLHFQWIDSGTQKPANELRLISKICPLYSISPEQDIYHIYHKDVANRCPWPIQRILWIGVLKHTKEECCWAHAPRDIVWFVVRMCISDSFSLLHLLIDDLD